MKLIATLITACLAVTLNQSSTNEIIVNDCSATLVVEKDRSSKSANEDGAQFTLVLTNTSRSSKTFTLSSKNLNTPCRTNANYNRGSRSENSRLDVTIQSNDLGNRTNTPSNTKVLKSGESYKFNVNVKVPAGTPYNTWSCIEIEAKSTDCDSISETKTLSVYVVDPTEG